MTLANHFDVTNVGTGPAGSTAAKLLCDAGVRVALIDKAIFPRHKTCASWINRLAFEHFPYLHDRIEALVDVPFYGIRFFNRDLTRESVATEKKPSGYLTFRSKFDNGLKDIAVQSSARFFEGISFRSFGRIDSGLEIVTSAEERITTSVLIGADGVNSRVAEPPEIRHGWESNQLIFPFFRASIQPFSS